MTTQSMSLAYVLLTALPVAAFALSTQATVPPDIIGWAAQPRHLAIVIAAVFGGLVEVYIAAQYHGKVSWLQAPKGLAGVAARSMFNTVCGIMVLPAVMEQFFSGASIQVVLGISFILTMAAPQLVPKLLEVVVRRGESQIDRYDIGKEHTAKGTTAPPETERGE